MKYELIICAAQVALIASVFSLGVIFERMWADRAERARAEGVARAERVAAEAGGWDAYVRKSVNGWCVRNGKPLAYPGYGATDD